MSCFSLDTTAYFAFTSISLTTYFSFILDFIFLSSFSLLTYTIHSYLRGKCNMIYLPYTVIFPLFHPQKWDSNTDRGWSKVHLIYIVLKSSLRSLCLLLVMAFCGVWHSRIHATRKNSSMEWDIPHLWDTSHQGRNCWRATMGAARRNQSLDHSWAASSDGTHFYAFSHHLICILLLTEVLATGIDKVGNEPLVTTNLVKEQVSLNKSADTNLIK